MFLLNNEELQVLGAIRDLNAGKPGEKTDYYSVVDAVGGDTAKLIPVVARLEDDGYIRSKGIIKRYCIITQKGRDILSRMQDGNES